MTPSSKRRGVLFGAAVLLILMVAVLLFRADAPAPPDSLHEFDVGETEVDSEDVHRARTPRARPNPAKPAEEVDDAPPPTHRPSLRVRLQWEGGEAIPSAPIMMIRPDGHREIRDTDERGEVEFESTGRSWLVGRPPAAPPVTREVSASVRSVALVARRGFRVLGRLFIDDVPAGEGYRLFINPRSYGWNVIPMRIIKTMPRNETPQGFEVVTDAEGRFVIEALPPIQGFGVRLPPGLRVAKNAKYATNTRLHVEKLLHDDTVVEIRTTPSPSLVGTCLDASGRPLVGVHVRFLHQSGRHFFNLVPPVETDEKGRFRGWIHPGSSVPFSVEVDWGGMLSKQILEEGWTGEKVIPPFVFPLTASCLVHVRDASGRAFAGAEVGLRGHPKLVLETDARGEARLDLVPDHTVILQVAAKGYRFSEQEVTLPPDGGEVTFDLAPAVEVTVRLETPEGRPIPGRSVSLAATPAVFRDPHAAESAAFLASLAPIESDGRPGYSGVYGRTDARGEIHAHDINPTSSLLARYYGAGGMLPLSEDGPRSLGDVQHALFRVVLDSKRSSTLRGRVVDVDGHPLRDARVLISQSTDGSGRPKTTDVEGRFVFRENGFHAAYFFVSKPGYIMERRFVEGLLASPPDLAFTLRKALECEILVKDSHGRLAPEANLLFPYRRDGGAALVDRRGDGTFHVWNLSEEPVKFRVAHGWAPLIDAVLHPVTERKQVIHLPPKGHVRVTWESDGTSHDIIEYQDEDGAFHFLGWVSSQDATDAFLLPGRYRIGRVHRVDGKNRFRSPPITVVVKVDSDHSIHID